MLVFSLPYDTAIRSPTKCSSDSEDWHISCIAHCWIGMRGMGEALERSAEREEEEEAGPRGGPTVCPRHSIFQKRAHKSRASQGIHLLVHFSPQSTAHIFLRAPLKSPSQDVCIFFHFPACQGAENAQPANTRDPNFPFFFYCYQ